MLTFEVKTADHIDVSAVYEALAHRRGATRSYVMLEVPNEQSELLEDALGIVRDEASRHGIGVIEFSEPGDIETWNETVEAVRGDADPQKINQFINIQFSAATKEAVNKRAKS